jgi:signal transduction histidine kinase
MWQRLVANICIVLSLLSACSPADRQTADKLNSFSYAYHYRSLDSTELYARQALGASKGYGDGQAEALNNIAFVRLAQMRYEEASEVLNQIPEKTSNQLELLVSYIQQMRLCQRTSRNREFYDFREQAIRSLHRIDEERTSLDERQQQRLMYAESELAIVTSTYYYYVGLEEQSAKALEAVPDQLERDTAQYLNYLYNIGAGGIITEGTPDDILQREFDYLMHCFLLAERSGIKYFSANSLEAIAEHLINADSRELLISKNLPSFKFLCADDVPDDSLALDIAYRSLEIFQALGDVYQIAGAHRTLASCYWALDDYEAARVELELALSDSIINKAPDLVASIREQLSVAYAALNSWENVKENRRNYLDLQERTRQDRSLEARAGQLEQATSQLNVLIWAVVAGIALLMVLLVIFFRRHRRKNKISSYDTALQQEADGVSEQQAMMLLKVENGERLALEQRAKVSLVVGITPLIDRIIHEARLLGDNVPADILRERIEYISELTDDINHQNSVLTHWIQLRQGELSLHIETFPLQELFDILAKGKRSFSLKGVNLDVAPTDCRVKADRVLTLFMLNTLADNARKFTPEGGSVNVYAEEQEDYVEVSVADTGVGMTEEQVSSLFSVKAPEGGEALFSARISSSSNEESHGFGLLNCKGIVEKYRKISKIFSVCTLAADSKVGHGSRFFFRLPKGIVRTVAFLLLTFGGSFTAVAESGSSAEAMLNLSRASALADSVRFANEQCYFDYALDLADSCRHYLNLYYLQQEPASADTLKLWDDAGGVPADVLWFRKSVPLEFVILLNLRDELAVSALAIHDWPLYHYNNRIYTQLLKEISADATLDDYCRKMQQSRDNKQVAIILLVVLFVSILMAIAWQVMASMGRAARRRQEHLDRLELMRDNLSRTQMEEAALHVSNSVLDNCLSTLKHETMYYPSRIRHLIDSGDTASVLEVVSYYREIYGILSQQAVRQTEHIRLHLKPVDLAAMLRLNGGSELQGSLMVLGDKVLLRYLFDIIRRQTGEKSLNASCKVKDSKYIDVTVTMPNLRLSPSQASQLFTPASSDNIPYLLCRQIVRDHGEATNRRACAVRAETKATGGTDVVITLPRVIRNANTQ